jgi:hypothetical protein
MDLLYSGPIYKYMMISVDLFPLWPTEKSEVYSSHPWEEHINMDGCQLFFFWDEYGEVSGKMQPNPDSQRLSFADL